MNEDVKVSVLTTTYNHAPFIRQTLDSILKQKTEFDIEIIVHDDASTDGTADIVREYAKRYAPRIRPVLQSENQYSQGKNVYDFIGPMIRGEYVAQCEGDDYWCDEQKLQKQVDFLEQHPDYIACVHNTRRLKYGSGRSKILFPTDGDRDVTFSELLQGGNACYHSSSLVMRSCFRLPKAFQEITQFGDYCVNVALGLAGKIRYFDTVMSVYRFRTPGSWSEWQAISVESRIQKDEAILRMMEILEEYSAHQYTEEIQAVVQRTQYDLAEQNGQYEQLRRGAFRSLYLTHPRRYRVKLWLKQHGGLAYQMYRMLRTGNKRLRE